MHQAIKTALLAAGLIGQAAIAAPVLWDTASGGNGHYYQFVADSVTWSEAMAASQASTFNGMNGYLATAVNAAENRFISATVAQNALAWLSGSDDGAEGNWTWRAGPESGQALTYFSWNAGEPNNCCGGENFLHTNWGGVGNWNDIGSGYRNGYVIEYSAAPDGRLPEPATLALALGALAAVGTVRRRAR